MLKHLKQRQIFFTFALFYLAIIWNVMGLMQFASRIKLLRMKVQRKLLDGL
uniref:Uncharacterized protein n=1 Tax=Picea sitchensis TaxID=3332 RepID=A9NRK9_PICSI|nr:unknown [Picea sitchensis]